jgi:Zn-dependent protease with chaperone function
MAPIHPVTPTASSGFFAKRVVLALLLTAGFYALVLAVLALFGGLLYLLITSSSRIDVRVIVFLAIVPLIILKSLLPTRDKFVALGPKLDRAHEPALFATIDAVARQTGQNPPAEVYLRPDANADVTERGGILGFGSKRVMSIGMPLLITLSVSQLRGVLAHEFGHFEGGNMRLSGWIYRLRGAIGRTIDNLGFLQAPFNWYGQLFMRVTQSLSRQQEFEADRLAAGIVGSAVMADALRIAWQTNLAYVMYWRCEVMPLLASGYRPPIADGFSRYLNVQSTRDMIAAYYVEAAAEKTDLYDKHPAMSERIAAIHALRVNVAESDERSALSLVRSTDALEQALLLDLGGGDVLDKLRAISWEDAGSVYRERWQRRLQPFLETLRGLTLGDLGDYINAPTPVLVTALRAVTGNPSLSSVEARDLGSGIVSDAVALSLCAAGWQIGPVLGQPITLVHGDMSIQPHILASKIVNGEWTPAQWRDHMVQTGIAALPALA